MAGSLLSGLGKLVNTGAALVKHVNFANTAIARSGASGEVFVREYVSGLSDQSFSGLKLTIAGLGQNEKDVGRKAAYAHLVSQIDAARSGEAVAERPGARFEANLALVHKWYDESDQAQQSDALIDHVGQLSRPDYKAFADDIGTMISNVESQIEAHRTNEQSAWGGYAEDRINYMMASLQTGQKDPAWQQQMDGLQSFHRFFQWVHEASDQVRQSLEAKVTTTAGATDMIDSVEAERILDAVRESTRTGAYPGGLQRQQADLMAMIAAGRGDEIMEILNAAGANLGGNTPLNADDYYRPGDEPFVLRWPLRTSIPGPFSFEECPRDLQFSILFSNWTVCEVEGLSLMAEGDADRARDRFNECLGRAEQLDVGELTARSHENLARLAEKTNMREAQRMHLKQAIAARAQG